MSNAVMSARPMRDAKYTPSLNEKQILYYRAHPIQATKDLLDIELIWLQRITLRMIWFCRFPLLNLSRGTGKSFIIAIATVLSALLYPRMKIGIIAPVFRQANYVFDYITDFYNSSPYLKSATLKAPSRGSAQSIFRFHNGSFIEALPVGDGTKIRGRRYFQVYIDEYAQMSEQIIKLVIRPMLNVKRKGKENKLIVASTAYYRWNHFWTLYLFYMKQVAKGNKDYAIAEFDYKDIVNTPDSPYRIDMDIIKMQQNDMTHEEFLMENGCVLGDTCIYTDRGVKYIKDIKVGDNVLTHMGRFRKVLATSERHYEGPLNKVYFENNRNPLDITPEHPIYLNKEWIAPEAAVVGDMGFFPKLQFIIPDDCSIELQFPIEIIHHYLYSGLVHNLEVDEDNSYIANGLAVHNCLFPAEGTSFISARLIDACTPKIPDPLEPELFQDDADMGTKYVLGIDCARVSGGDNFAVQVLKLDGYKESLVNTFTMNGGTFQEMAEAVRGLLLDFNVIRMHIGAGGGGLTLKDLLAENWKNRDGEKMLPLLDMDDPEHQHKTGLHVVKIVNETQRKNNELYMNMKAEMQHKRLLFPIDIKSFNKESKVLQRVYSDILSTKRELLVLEAIPHGAYHKFTVPSKYKKDRATALVMAVDAAIELRKVEKTEVFGELPIGMWVA